MATIKQLTTDALQDIDDGAYGEALYAIVAAIEELDDAIGTIAASASDDQYGEAYYVYPLDASDEF